MSLSKIIIGLTGKYCSGKSTVEVILQEKYNFEIIDVDKLGHIALKEKKTELVKEFGIHILSGENVDRKILGNIVFNDKIKLKKLNSIVHPFMVNRVRELLSKSGSKLICINAALLYEMKLHNLCNYILFIKTSIIEAIKRGKKRDSFSFYKIIKILLTQKAEMLAKKNTDNADIFYIKNNKNKDNLLSRIDKIISEEIICMSKNKKNIIL